MNPDNDYVEVWHAQDGWRWRRKDTANHRIVSESGEAFTEHRYALASASSLNEGCPIIDIEEH